MGRATGGTDELSNEFGHRLGLAETARFGQSRGAQADYQRCKDAKGEKPEAPSGFRPSDGDTLSDDDIKCDQEDIRHGQLAERAGQVHETFG